jgi:hypothetical protein
MGLIVAGFGTFVYAATTLTNLFTSGEAVAHIRRSRGKRMRSDMDRHVIVVASAWSVRRWPGGSGISNDPAS